MIGYSQALDIDVGIVFRKLFEEDNLQSDFIEGLEQAFLVVADLSESILVKTDMCLLVIDRGKNQMEVLFEGFELG